MSLIKFAKITLIISIFFKCYELKNKISKLLMHYTNFFNIPKYFKSISKSKYYSFLVMSRDIRLCALKHKTLNVNFILGE